MTEPSITSGRVAATALGGAVLLVLVAVVFSAQAAIIGMAIFALAGAAARVFTPLRRAFVVRRRLVDVAVLLVFGLVLLYLGVTTPLD